MKPTPTNLYNILVYKNESLLKMYFSFLYIKSDYLQAIQFEVKLIPRVHITAHSRCDTNV